MSELLNQGLLITAIGMGLVFLTLILFWWLLAALVSIPIKEKQAEEETEAEAEEETPEPVQDLRALKRRAAAAAVAAALAVEKSKSALLPPVSNISPWQAALRSGHLNQSVHLYNRKSRGSAR